MKEFRVFFSAGEVSGDISASEVISELVKLGIKCYGIGGPRMRKSGMISITDTDESVKSSVGFTESLKYVFPKLFLLRKVSKYLKENKPDLVFLIDNQGFNIPLAKISKKLGVRVYYYFPPMVSVWGENTKYKVAKYCDKILCTFKEDYEIYRQVSDGAVFVGLPLLDRIQKNYSSKDEYLKFFDPSKKRVLLLFGSREQEIKTLTLPILETVKKILFGETPLKPNDYEFYTVISHPIFKEYVLRSIEFMGLKDKIKVFDNVMDYALYDVCDVAISSSGTITLELALLEKPVIVVYKVSKITFEIGKRLVRKQYISLPNLLLNEKVYPELLQDQVNWKVISENLEVVLDDKVKEEIRKKLYRLKVEYRPGAVDRIVEEIRSEAPLIK